MPIGTVADGDTGLSVRTKLNQAFGVLDRTKAVQLQLSSSEVLTAGQQGGYLFVPQAVTIVAGYLASDVNGSVSVDVWVCPVSDSPPTVADSITASAPLVLSAAAYSADSVLVGWTKAIPANSLVAFNLTDPLLIKKLTVALTVVPTLS